MLTPSINAPSLRLHCALLVALMIVLLISGCAGRYDKKYQAPDWVSQQAEDDNNDTMTVDELSKVDITDEAIAQDQAASTPTNASTPPTLEQDNVLAAFSKGTITLPQAPAPMAALTAENNRHRKQAEAANAAYQKALALIKQDQLAPALKALQSLTQQYPLLSGPLTNIAIIQRQQGQLEAAKQTLLRAASTPSKSPYALNLLGIVNRELGLFSAAKQAYLAAIQLDTHYANAHYNLAVLADLYLRDDALALTHFEAYQTLQTQPNKRVKGWIKYLKRRIKRAS